ncbi:hypothetical protein K488DRAFT_73116 [Vararia minispora EC-137]|uniref:Uncharacterized protein n=1 Tax=Vararia minispora EC-137 TaxID=1314806 RepID=A0ACB8QC15_9AGAM|nr:hypothetical protein K488DRAFT_73116 [Vararia minispora EC-137]
MIFRCIKANGWLSLARVYLARSASEGTQDYRMRLEAECGDLKEYLQAVFVDAQRHRNALQPFNLLPVELWGKIFLQVRDEWPGDIGSGSNISWIRACSQVCHYWREVGYTSPCGAKENRAPVEQIALSLSSLWDRIDSDRCSVKLSCLMLVRARDSPLSVFIDPGLCQDEHRLKDNAKVHYFVTTPPFSNRLHSLHVYMSPSFYLNVLPERVFPLLEFFSVTDESHDYGRYSMLENIDPTLLPALRTLRFDNCFTAWPIASGSFANLVDLSIRRYPSYTDPADVSKVDFVAILSLVPHVERLALWEAFPWPILAQRPSARPSIALPSRLQSLSVAFFERTRPCLPLLKSLIIPQSIALDVQLSAKRRWVGALNALVGSTRPPPRCLLLSTTEVLFDAHWLWYEVSYTHAWQGSSCSDPDPPVITTMRYKASPLDGLPLRSVETFIIRLRSPLHHPFSRGPRGLATLPAPEWRTALARAHNVRTLELNIDAHWLPLLMRVLQCAAPDGGTLLPRLERLVLTDADETPGPPPERIVSPKTLDVVRRSLVTRARAGVPVRTISLPRRFEGVCWAEDLRCHVEELLFDEKL